MARSGLMLGFVLRLFLRSWSRWPMAVGTDLGKRWRMILVVAGNGHDLKCPRSIARVQVAVVGLKAAAWRNRIALVFNRSVYTPLATIGLAVALAVGGGSSVFHNPGGSRTPRSTT